MLSITSFMKGKKRKNKIGAQQSGSDFERKKEPADAEFSRLRVSKWKRSFYFEKDVSPEWRAFA